MNLREQALRQLTDLHQAQVVEALADTQGLPDSHPIWAVVALLAASTPKAGEGRDMQASVEASAQLSRQMPDFLSRLEQVLGSMQSQLVSIESRLARLEARPGR